MQETEAFAGLAPAMCWEACREVVAPCSPPQSPTSNPDRMPWGNGGGGSFVVQLGQQVLNSRVIELHVVVVDDG